MSDLNPAITRWLAVTARDIVASSVVHQLSTRGMIMRTRRVVTVLSLLAVPAIGYAQQTPADLGTTIISASLVRALVSVYF